MDTTLLEGWYAGIPLGLLVFARILGLFVVGPIIGGPYTPMRVKALIALAVTLMLTPLRLAAESVPPVDGMYIVLMAKEFMVGASIGFFLLLFVEAIRFGGDLANRHAGFSAAESFDPETEAATSPIGDLYFIMAVMMFLIMDGHHVFIAAIVKSYAFIPTGGFAPGPAFMTALIDASNQMFLIALALSAPVLSTILAITIAEAVIARAVPQINFLQFGFALKIMVSLLVLWAGVPAAVGFLGLVLAGAQTSGYAMMRLLGG